MTRWSATVATCVALAFALLAAPAAAQQTNTQERTFLTFSSPVELPGVTLPAGTYVFRLADTPSRNVVQVLNEKETDILGQWLFVQTERPKVSDETIVVFGERKEGATAAVQYWYFPGERIGKEFVYPEDQATQIAARTGQTVLSTDGEISADATVFTIDAKGNRTARDAAAAAAQRQAVNQPAAPNALTLTGCVYQLSDDPTLFALRRMDGTSVSASASAGSADRSVAGAIGTTGVAAGAEAGAWYRLGPDAQRDLSRYVGQRVEVNGRLTPGRDERGADVVVHRIEPDRVTVTALDLQPAPQLSISTIVPATGTCDAAAPAAR